MAFVAAICAGALLPSLAAAASEGSISGKVTDGTGAPIAYEEVCAEEKTEGGRIGYCGSANELGEYTIKWLANGSYSVGFTGQTCHEDRASECSQRYVPVFWGGADSIEQASSLRVEGSPVTGIDAVLERARTIEGVVRDAGSGQPIDQMQVCTGEPQRPQVDFLGGELCSRTASDGRYRIEGITPGIPVTVQFTGVLCASGKACPGNYIDQYYGEASTEAAAQALQVTQGALRLGGINARMVLGGEITGTVTEEGLALKEGGVEICAHQDAAGRYCEYTGTGRSTYAIGGLPSGDYTVEFCKFPPEPDDTIAFGCPTTVISYPESISPEGAVPVPVQACEVTTGVDEEMILSAAVATTASAPRVETATAPCEGTEGAPPLETETPPGSGTTPLLETEPAPVLSIQGPGEASFSAPPTPAHALPTKTGVASLARVAHVKGGRAVVRLRCTGPGPCKGEIELQAVKWTWPNRHGRAKRRPFTIGRASFTLAKGASEKLEIRLSRAGLKKLAGVGKHGLDIEVTGVREKRLKLLRAGKLSRA